MMMLTDHFSREELSHSDIAVRLGIDNAAPDAVLPSLRKLADVLEMIRAALTARANRPVAINVNSGHRCEALEKVLCAKDYKAWCARHGKKQGATAWREYFARKQHPKGQAADIIAPSFGDPLAIVRYIAAQPDIMQHIDQIIMEGTWVHVSVSDTPRGEVMTAEFDAAGVPRYLKGLA